MDPLTHTATGLFLSRIGLKRWTPLATPILLLAANAPDIDIVTASGGSLSYLHYHRHLTHSLVAMPVLALLTVGLVRFAARKPVHWAGAFFAALIAVASHLLLDWTNAYGIRLLLPFSAEWLRLDLNNIYDLWIWGVFLLCLAGPFVGRLVGSEIASGGAPGKHYGRGFAWLALLFVLLYDCGRGVLHARAVAALQSRLYAGAVPTRVAALPGPANPMRWQGVADTGDFYAVESMDLLAGFDPTRALILYKPPPDAAIEAARRTPVFQEVERFSQLPLWRVSPAPDLPGGRMVQLCDLRFGTPSAPAFMATAILDARLEPVRTWFAWGIASRTQGK
ncbi:MAG: metal-dependent hydrolase [Bryobacteraceae bacterium]